MIYQQAEHGIYAEEAKSRLKLLEIHKLYRTWDRSGLGLPAKRKVERAGIRAKRIHCTDVVKADVRHYIEIERSAWNVCLPGVY